MADNIDRPYRRLLKAPPGPEGPTQQGRASPAPRNAYGPGKECRQRTFCEVSDSSMSLLKDGVTAWLSLLKTSGRMTPGCLRSLEQQSGDDVAMVKSCWGTLALLEHLVERKILDRGDVQAILSSGIECLEPRSNVRTVAEAVHLMRDHMLPLFLEEGSALSAEKMNFSFKA